MEDHHVDRPEVKAQQCVQPTGTNRSFGLIHYPASHAASRPSRQWRHRPQPRTIDNRTHVAQRTGIRGQRSAFFSCSPSFVLCLPSRRPGGYGEGPNTRSHPELGREIPQRQWYCVLRRGRVGRRQVFKTEVSNQKSEVRQILYTDTQPTHTRPNTHSSSQMPGIRNQTSEEQAAHSPPPL